MAAPARRVAMVTGANKGLGFYIAKGLLTEGYAVVLACRSTDKGSTAADDLVNRMKAVRSDFSSQNLKVVHFDLDDESTWTSSLDEVRKSYPDGIDAIVHNAGFAYRHDSEEDFSKQAEKTTTINFFETIGASSALLPLVKDGGRVVFIASRAGYLSLIKKEELRREFVKPDATYDSVKRHVQSFVTAAKEGKHKDEGWPNSAYGVSKIGLAAYIRLFAKDDAVKKRNITVNYCCPGWCKTDMGGDDATKSPEEGADTPVWLVTSNDVAGTTGNFFGERKELDWENGSWD